jgi:hypothetical protein
MVDPAEYEAIMGPRTSKSLVGWRRTVVLVAVHISGAGKLDIARYRSVMNSPLRRSVHNTRIERVWYDVTNGFGGKWKRFFTELEVNHGLNVANPASIWLLHELFLESINKDALQWAQSWNSHKLQIKGERNKSPNEIFYFSMINDGPRGFEGEAEVLQQDEEVQDHQAFGIDWEIVDDDQLLAHHLANNPEEANENPFTAPPKFSHVPCEPPEGPFTEDEVAILWAELRRRVDIKSRSMLVRRNVWIEAMDICEAILNMRAA